ncbi:hypothetical protein CGLO_11987 [Colletotrichum gloeosporioides Cg-14]|uniref:Kievitone hydratase n=1 Tax=Colletotrichum gloeosporioides (strain Cg-14) TaxID=1237896 RepID=T0LKL0_COLGC|nr:hypothetical protein CGLO_11987 [Colletotrichum gloeosporioides Cg-14]
MFRPDDHSTYVNTRIPSVYNFSSNQTTGSYWTSFVLTTTSGSQYLSLPQGLGNICKSSLLEPKTLDYWNNLKYVTPQNTSLAAPGFEVSHLQSAPKWWKRSLRLRPGLRKLHHAAVSGSLSVGNINHTVDPAASLTWYDYQEDAGAPQNWPWFQRHFPGSSTKASIWACDFGSPSFETFRFVTVRVGEEPQYVIPFNMEAGGGACGSWTSTKPNIIDTQSWTLNLENGDAQEVQSMRGDQEIHGSRQLSDTVYAGYVNVSGSFLEQEGGFGVVEMIKLY